MTINQTNASSSADLWQLLQAVQSSQTNSTSSSAQTTSTSSTGDSASISGPGQLFKELEQLSKSNPSEFKQITASISQQLTAAAKNSTDPGQAQFLTQLAANFDKASQSGNFSDLFPQQNGSSGSQTSTPSVSSSYSSNSSDPLASIFSQALQQIQTYLNGTSSTTSSS